MSGSTVARARTPRGELVLRQRGDGHLELRANGVFVMDTLEHTSEHALAEEALQLADGDRLRVLLGGLGLGFTLGSVLADPRVERCTVVEIEPDLVAWMRGGTVPHGPALLSDPRTEVFVADIADALGDLAADSHDLVLLDVDNGPAHLVHETNARLYRPTGLHAIRRALAEEGVVAIWSASPAPVLEATLRAVFGPVRTRQVRAPGHGRAGPYWLYAARHDLRTGGAALTAEW